MRILKQVLSNIWWVHHELADFKARLVCPVLMVFSKDMPCLLLFFVQEWLLDNHTRNLAKFFKFFAYGVFTSLGADQLSNLLKSSTAICTYYSSQLSSFPIIEDRRSSRPGLRLYCSMFFPLLVNSTYSSFGNVFFNGNLYSWNAFAASSNNFFFLRQS